MATHLACSNLYMLFDTIKRGLELSQSANILRVIRCNDDDDFIFGAVFGDKRVMLTAKITV
ncbi:hypothetical protein SDJN02_13208 [Cucurbita argyrosperma subsp. argyrosperma]|nr:hypothetical protein SDJN02_13208 [Cucurbita argyrosperma subsp. argyrosperma]